MSIFESVTLADIKNSYFPSSETAGRTGDEVTEVLFAGCARFGTEHYGFVIMHYFATCESIVSIHVKITWDHRFTSSSLALNCICLSSK